MPRRRVDHQSWRFVDDQQGLVFVDNLQGERLRSQAGWPWWGDIERDDIPAPYPITGCCRPLGKTDPPLLDEPLQLAPRQLGHMRRQVLVETGAGVFSLHLEHPVLRRHG